MNHLVAMKLICVIGFTPELVVNLIDCHYRNFIQEQLKLFEMRFFQLLKGISFFQRKLKAENKWDLASRSQTLRRFWRQVFCQSFAH